MGGDSQRDGHASQSGMIYGGGAGGVGGEGGGVGQV